MVFGPTFGAPGAAQDAPRFAELPAALAARHRRDDDDPIRDGGRTLSGGRPGAVSAARSPCARRALPFGPSAGPQCEAMGRKADATKHRVERAALTLFTARGVAETTTKEIALAASVAEGTIYRYFESKEALAVDLFLRHHTALAEALKAAHRPHRALRAKTEAIVRTYCRLADEDWTLFAYHLLTQHSHLVHVPKDAANPVDVIRDVVAAAMRAGEIPKRNPDLVGAAAVGVVLQAAIYKVYGRFDGPLTPHVPLFVEAAWGVLSAKSG